jgi:hypothetical protein
VEYELPKTTVGWGVREYQAFSNLTRVAFSKDKHGNTISPAAELLVAGAFSRGTGIDVFLRSPLGHWSYDPIPPQSYLPRGLPEKITSPLPASALYLSRTQADRQRGAAHHRSINHQAPQLSL